jgi:hypothetical protein
VKRRRRQLGLIARESFVPQSYNWGVQGQVDRLEAWALVGGERIKLQVFEMRSMASGGAYHRAFTHATQILLPSRFTPLTRRIPIASSGLNRLLSAASSANRRIAHRCRFVMAADRDVCPMANMF